MRRRDLPLLLSLLLVGASCASAPVAPTDHGVASASASASAAPSSAPPALGLVVGPPNASASSAPSAVAAVLPAFAGTFTPVQLPTGTPGLVDVAGRGPDDVWLLASDNTVLSWNGKSLTNRGAPDCYAEACCARLVDCKATPALCNKAKADNCGVGDPNCALHVAFRGLEFGEDGGVVADAIVNTWGMRGGFIEAHHQKNDKWTCHQSNDDRVLPGSRGSGDTAHADEEVIDGVTIRWEGPAVLVNLLGGFSLVIDGRRVALPEVPGMVWLDFEAAAPDDLWLWTSSDASLWHGNGLDWTPVATPLASIANVWVDRDRTVWLLGASTPEPGSEELLRRDGDHWQRTPVPGATGVRPYAGGFWLIGEDAVYHHDGTTLSYAPAPLRIRSTWLDASGDAWFVGATPTAAPPKDDAPEDPGVAAAVRVARAPKGGARP